MKVFLDTNVVVDILSKRGGYDDSLRILALCETCRITGFVSAVTVTDVWKFGHPCNITDRYVEVAGRYYSLTLMSRH
jgi:hypothetical protein